MYKLIRSMNYKTISEEVYQALEQIEVFLYEEYLNKKLA